MLGLPMPNLESPKATWLAVLWSIVARAVMPRPIRIMSPQP